MINWAWLLVALFVGNVIGYVIAALGAAIVKKEEVAKAEEIGYSKAMKEVRVDIAEELTRIKSMIEELKNN